MKNQIKKEGEGSISLKGCIEYRGFRCPIDISYNTEGDKLEVVTLGRYEQQGLKINLTVAASGAMKTKTKEGYEIVSDGKFDFNINNTNS